MDLKNSEILFSMEKEIDQWKERKRALEEQVKELKQIRDENQHKLTSHRKSCSELYEVLKLISGIEVVYLRTDEIFLRFHPMYRGKAEGSYSMQLNKVMGSWTATYCDMPYPCLNVSKALELLNVVSLSDLWSFIYLTFHKVSLYIHRKRQFREAQEALKSFAVIYPSLDTLRATIEMTVKDIKDDSNISVLVSLRYKPNKALPEEPSLKFEGASLEAQQQFIKDLVVLKQYSIKEAIIMAFHMNDSEDSFGNSSDECDWKRSRPKQAWDSKISRAKEHMNRDEGRNRMGRERRTIGDSEREPKKGDKKKCNQERQQVGGAKKPKKIQKSQTAHRRT